MCRDPGTHTHPVPVRPEDPKRLSLVEGQWTCYVMVCYGMVWYGMVWYVMVWYVLLWYGMVWYGMPCYVMVWYVMLGYVMVCLHARPVRAKAAARVLHDDREAALRERRLA